MSEAAVRTEAVYFSITGEYITGIARDFVIEENWEGALELLLDSLQGLTHEQAIQVLNGEKRFTGSSNDPEGVEFEDEVAEVAEKYLAEVREIYAGRTRTSWGGQKGWWRPIAEVVDFGEKDATGRPTWMSPEWAEFNHPAPKVWSYLNSNPPLRAWHYTYEDEWVAYWKPSMEKMATASHLAAKAIIFKRCQPRPLWMRPYPKTPKEAVDEFKAWRGDTLEVRGHSAWYPDHEGQGLFRSEPRKKEPIKSEDFMRGLQGGETEEEREKRYQEEDRLNREKILGYREAIIAQTGDDWLELTDKIKVPRVPFEYWALRGFPHVIETLDPWIPVSPSGLRLQMDNPYHSDWMLGAGDDLSVFNSYNDRSASKDPVQSASFKAILAVQRKYCHIGNIVVLSPGKYASGKVVHPKPNQSCKKTEIAVIPAASPKYTMALFTAGAVITERGGALAHLSIVAAEQGKTLVQVPGARKRYPEGIEVEIDPKRGEIEIVEKIVGLEALE